MSAETSAVSELLYEAKLSIFRSQEDAMNSLKTAMLVFVLFWHPLDAFAFEADGYRAGMSLEEVRRLSGVLTLAPLGTSSRSRNYVTNGSSSRSGSFAFCDERLVSYSRTYPATIVGFLSHLAAITKDRGPGSYTSNDLPWEESGPGARYRDVSFSWWSGRYRLSLMLTDTTGGTRISNVSRTWVDTENPCRR